MIATLAALALAAPPLVPVALFHAREPGAAVVNGQHLVARHGKVCDGAGCADAVTLSGPLVVAARGGEERAENGTLTVRAAGGKLSMTLLLPLEEYVAGVVAAEQADAPPEALRALAVVVRTVALRGPGPRHHGAFCDQTHCQVFHGDGSERAREAALATRGVFLAGDDGAPAEVYFHAESGGRTVPPSAVWGGPAPRWLAGVDDEGFEAGAPHASWSAALDARAVATALGGPLEQESPASGAAPARFEVSARGLERELTGYEVYVALGRALGWGAVRSPRFTVRREGARYLFAGEGLGHGVGLAQYGAARMAQAGRSWREILRFYFPGVRLAGDEHGS